MRKMVGALSFVGLLVVAAVTPAAAISIFSTSNSASGGALTCASGANACAATDVFIVNPALPAAWTPTSPFNASAQWISYNADTSQSGSGPLNTSLLAPNVTINYALGVVSAPTLLTLHVWADDTAAVRLNNGVGTLFATDPAATYSLCASSGITCGGGGTLISFLVPANASAYQLSFDLFQRGGDGSPFGLMWDGDFATAAVVPEVPEPATILLLGSALTAAGVASRRRWRKTP